MLTQRVDLFDSTYGHFTEEVLTAARRETFGLDIGQPPGVNERFEGLQKFFGAVHRLTSERRLSRFVYLVQKRAE